MAMVKWLKENRNLLFSFTFLVGIPGNYTYFVYTPASMELKMELDHKLIDSVAINFEKILIPGYLENLKSELENKYAEKIKEAITPPIFYVDHVPSSMNKKN